MSRFLREGGAGKMVFLKSGKDDYFIGRGGAGGISKARGKSGSLK